MRSVAKHWGVFICFVGCIDGASQKVGAHTAKWRPLLSEARVAKGIYSSSAYLWKADYADSRGERCGPLVSIDGARGKTVAKRLEEMDEGAKEDGGVILRAFDACVGEAKKWAGEKDDMKEAASKKRAQKRRQAVEKVMEKVAAALAHDPWARFADVQG